MHKKSIVILIAYLLILLFLSCGGNTTSDEYGVIDLSIDFVSSGRTIMYSFCENTITDIRIDYISGPEYLPSQTLSFENDYELLLQSGSWVIDIYGLDSMGNEIAYSNVFFIIEKTEITNIEIILEALSNNNVENTATGTVSARLDWSCAGNSVLPEVSFVTASWGLVDGTLTDISSQLDVDDIENGSATFLKSPCPSGNYIINFYLRDSDGTVIAAVAAAVNVRDFLVSSGTILLEQDDFNLGGINLSISLDLPVCEPISFNYADDIVFSSTELSSGVNVTITTQETFDSYNWSLYGSDLSSFTGNSVTLPSELSAGVHHLTLFLEKSGSLFSETLRFIITG